MATLLTQTAANAGVDATYTDSSNYLHLSQTFTVPEGVQWSVSNISVKLYRSVDGAGDATVALVVWHGDDIPTDTLASGVIDASTITTDTAGAFYDVAFSELLDAGTYAVRVEPLTTAGVVSWRASNANPLASSSFWIETVSGGAYSSEEYADYDAAVVITGTEIPTTTGKATTPSPADTATGQSLNVDLSWANGDPAADTFDVYFGPTGSMVLVSEGQAGLIYDPGALAYGVEYSWRIDTTSILGTTEGDVWSFTSVVFAPPEDIATNKRLVACANNKFWYEDI